MMRLLCTIMVMLCISDAVNAQFGSEQDIVLKADVSKLVAAGKNAEALNTIQKIEEPNVRNAAQYDFLEALFKKGDEAEGIRYAGKWLDSFRVLSAQPAKKYWHSNLLNAYGHILMNANRYAEAYPVWKEMIDLKQPVSYAVPEMYVKSMNAIGHYEEAIGYIKEVIVKGAASPLVTDTLFKQAYIGWKGKEAGFNLLKDSVLVIWKKAIKEEVQKHSADTIAPLFTLKDADDNFVSLASLRGKTVLLDFWANWCMPCKASFPVMQKVQNRFKKDTNVVFLFIHCMEREADPVTEAVTYMKAHHFDFKVLFDLRDSATKVSPVSKAYAVQGIPTKCIIDPAGHIRFVSVGGTKYTETDTHSVEYISTMIEVAAAGSN